MILVPAPLDTAAFAPFGQVVDLRGQDGAAINGGTTTRIADLARLDVRGASADPAVHLYVARARTFPLAIATLERHREADQTFVPLGGQRFVVIVAGRDDAFSPTDLRAFVTAPGQGVVIARGCWHHALVALGEGDRFLVIEGGNYRHDAEVRDVPAQAFVLAPA